MLSSKRLVILIGIVSITVLIIVSCLVLLPNYWGDGNSPCRPELFAPANFHACFEPEQFDDLKRVQLTLMNNTPDLVTPAQDMQAYNWGLYKQTAIGWRFFTPNHFNRFSRSVPGATKPIRPQEIRKFEAEMIRDIFDASVTNNSFASIFGQQVLEFPGDGGIFVIEIEYTIHLSTGDATQITYTNPFTYKQPRLKDRTIGIHLQPELVVTGQRKQVEFVITNKTDRPVWLRPLGLSIRGDRSKYGPEFSDIRLRRKVNQTSWETIEPSWLIAKQAAEPLEIAAETTRRLQGPDLDTEFIITEEGEYLWIIPIWAEYYPEGHANRDDGGGPDEPFLNQRYYIFSEPLVVN